MAAHSGEDERIVNCLAELNGPGKFSSARREWWRNALREDRAGTMSVLAAIAPDMFDERGAIAGPDAADPDTADMEHAYARITGKPVQGHASARAASLERAGQSRRQATASQASTRRHSAEPNMLDDVRSVDGLLVPADATEEEIADAMVWKLTGGSGGKKIRSPGIVAMLPPPLEPNNDL